MIFGISLALLSVEHRFTRKIPIVVKVIDVCQPQKPESSNEICWEMIMQMRLHIYFWFYKWIWFIHDKRKFILNIVISHHCSNIAMPDGPLSSYLPTSSDINCPWYHTGPSFFREHLFQTCAFYIENHAICCLCADLVVPDSHSNCHLGLRGPWVYHHFSRIPVHELGTHFCYAMFCCGYIVTSCAFPGYIYPYLQGCFTGTITIE